MLKGKWVQDYTTRGSPRSGRNKYRWSSRSDQILEILAGILIAALMVFAVIAPILFSE